MWIKSQPCLHLTWNIFAFRKSSIKYEGHLIPKGMLYYACTFTSLWCFYALYGLVNPRTVVELDQVQVVTFPVWYSELVILHTILKSRVLYKEHMGHDTISIRFYFYVYFELYCPRIEIKAVYCGESSCHGLCFPYFAGITISHYWSLRTK